MIKLSCPCCGADSVKIEGDICKCKYCGASYLIEKSKEYVEEIKNIFGDLQVEQKMESVANARQNLWNAVHAENVSDKQVVLCVNELKRLLPDDFQARFYEIAVSGTPKQINAFLDNVDVEKNGMYVELIADFMLRSLVGSNVLPLKELITRGLKGKKYTDYITKVEDEAEKLKNGIYSPQVPRDVFVAYSSKDYKAVNEIVEFLEENKITCFVASRNLRHGRGAAENYKNNLIVAMHNCKCVVFISSDNSRDLDCDALKIELPYIKDNEPEMGRIEYLLTNYGKDTPYVAKRILESFFNGLEYCRSKEDLVDRILRYITGDMGGDADVVAEQIRASDKARAKEEKRRKKEEQARQKIAERSPREAEAKSKKNNALSTTESQTDAIAKAKQWSVVKFGRFPQQTNMPEPIEWYVISSLYGQKLLLSKYILTCMNNEDGARSWEDCNVRDWLNGEFLKEAFDGTERKRICETSLESFYDRKTDYVGSIVKEALASGSDYIQNNNVVTTSDKVFVLDQADINTYFPRRKKKLLAGYPTERAIKDGIEVDGKKAYSWLRTFKMEAKQKPDSSLVFRSYDYFYYGLILGAKGDPDGIYYHLRPEYRANKIGVRPLIWVNSTT